MKFSFLVLQIIVKVGGICAFVIYVTVNFKPGKDTRIMFFLVSDTASDTGSSLTLSLILELVIVSLWSCIDQYTVIQCSETNLILCTSVCLFNSHMI